MEFRRWPLSNFARLSGSENNHVHFDIAAEKTKKQHPCVDAYEEFQEWLFWCGK